MANTQTIAFKNFSWVNISDPTSKQLEQLREEYGFHPLDIADCLTSSHRSKVDIYEKYLFIVLLFPMFNPETREIVAAEFDIFIGTNYLITIQHGELAVFNNFFDSFKQTPSLREHYNDKSPEKLLYQILNKLLLYTLPMIDHLVTDCDEIETAIFTGREKKMISEILIIRRNITDLRKIMQVHKNVLKKTVSNFKTSPLFVMKTSDAYFDSLIDYTKEIWDMLENLKERIEALQQTNESQISFRLSNIMRTLTSISVLTFPVTLLATIFGMNTTHSMPFINDQLGFWYVISIMISVILLMLAVFKKKDWM